VRIVIDSGAVEDARQQALQHVRRACNALEALPPSPYREALADLAQSVTSRIA
jgi:octaprenyl-diphosphate synthase